MQPTKILLLLALVCYGFAEEMESQKGPHPSQFSVRHLEYQGIGFNQGYTTLELFLANGKAWRESNYLFLDLRGHVFNNGKPALNAGCGWRYLFDSGCHAIGVNTYYDYRKTNHKNYNQMGMGFEYLSPLWEFRANGYLPFGAKVSQVFDLRFDHFFRNNFFVSRKHEYTMAGADAEVGWHFKQWDQIDLFLGVGPYCFKGHYAESAIGGKVRIKARLTPYVSFEVGDSYDAVFQNRFQAQLAISIPFGPRAKTEGTCSCKQQYWIQQWVHDAPTRSEILVVDTKKKTSLGLNPATGLPYFFVFVNNTSSSNGTFESPFPTLAQGSAASKPGDTIYVFPGDGTTAGMSAGIVLQSDQRFLGSGVSHEYVTTVGTMTIPPQTELLPLITSGAAVVTLVQNNEVSGFNILGGTAGIISSAPAWTNGNLSANINRNQILGTAGDGIQLTPIGCVAQIVIDSNQIIVDQFTGGNGIICSSQSSVGNALIQNNSIIEPPMRGINMTHTLGSQLNTQIISNSILNCISDNILIDTSGVGTFVNTLIEGNQVVFSLQSFNLIGIYARTRDDSANYSTIINNDIRSGISSGTIREGIYVHADNSTSALSQTVTHIQNNTVIAGCGGILLHTDFFGSGSLNGKVINNQITSYSSGIGASAGLSILPEASIIRAEVSGNLIEKGNADGLNIFVQPMAQLELICTGNTFRHNHNSGVECFILGTATVLFENNQILDNAYSGTGSPGFRLTVADFAAFCRARVINNTFKDNISEGFQSQVANNGGTLCLRLNGNVSDNDYSVYHTTAAGILQFEPPQNNVGAVVLGTVPGGPITHVPPGTCD